MFLDKPEKKSNVILTGPALVMDTLRERRESAGKNCPVTSWFFLFQHFLKAELRNSRYSVDSVSMVGNAYGIKKYARGSFGEWFVKRLQTISKNSDWLNPPSITKEDGVEVIELDLSRKDFSEGM